MHLDMQTMSAVNVTVTAILGGVLLFTWARERDSAFVGWWGLALVIMSAGVILSSFPVRPHADLLHLGLATIALSDALKWKAAQEFALGRARLLPILLGPIGFLVALQSGYLDSFDHELGVLCTILAVYNFAAAGSLAGVTDEQLPSRWPAVILLVVIGLGYLSWLPLNLAMPIGEVQWVGLSAWFPGIILLTLLLRITLAFIVLSMAKERQELEQRVDALTDALTGLPNRRALFEVADALGQNRQLGGAAISVLIFDLDHFKETNDRFGHALGDRVLKLFANTASTHLNGPSVVARLGGEEFVAILPGADPLEAFGAVRPCAVPLPIPRPLSTAWRWVPRSASARRPMSASRAISTLCSAVQTPLSMWPSGPGAIGSNCWDLTMPASMSSASRGRPMQSRSRRGVRSSGRRPTPP